MFKNINWKKFIISSIIIFTLLILIADVAIDKFVKPKEFSWEKIFGFENLFWKILAAIIGAYFYSSPINKNDKKN